MKKIKNFLVCTAVVFALTCCTNANKQLETDFVTPASSVQTSIYWFWIQGHISKDGVIKDLQAMKAAGINRAFIGNVGGSYFEEEGNLQPSSIKLFSDKWWDVMHTALKTAGELGIEIGLYNSPGWSGLGGPWVKPEQAMRYLSSSELRVQGAKRISVKLEKPEENFQDVKVIAYPAPKSDMDILNTTNAQITSLPKLAGLKNIFDANVKSALSFPAGGHLTIDFSAKENFTARSLTVYPSEQPTQVNVELQVKEGGVYRSVSTFLFDRTNPSLNVGWYKFPPVVVSIPATKAKDFRLIFNNSNPKAGIAEVELSASPRVESYIEKSLAKMSQTPFPYWPSYLWREQPTVDDASLLIDPTKVQDISQHMAADGTLTWDVPGGEWVIIRTGMTPTGVKNSPAAPEGEGLMGDKMNRQHVEKHFNDYLGKILERIPAGDRKTFKIVVEDSYENGSLNFTDDFLNTFQKQYGYNPLPYLPVLRGKVVGSQDASDRFLWDLRRIVADKISYEGIAGLRDISHKHGLTLWLENYGHWGFAGEFLQYGGQSDEIGGEFWSEGALGDIENRAASSCGHIYGKNKISAESFTCGGAAYSRYPASMKQRADRFFTEGINHTVLCLYIHQAYDDKFPGINAPFSNEFNRYNTWFSQADVFIKYLKRVNYMLQQGLNVADVAYFIGEDAPKMTGITDPTLPTGYQFDYINAEVIVRDLFVKDGVLTLPHGTQYKILVLPKLETMRPEVLKKIKQLVADGAVVLGPAPNRSPSLQNFPEADKQVKLLAKELWGSVDGVSVKSAKFGKGTIMSGISLEEAFAIVSCIPDCKIPDGAPLLYGHRTLDIGEIYFVSNQSDKQQTTTLEFRVKGLQPELWDATSGSIRELSAYVQEKESTSVPIKLEPFGSAFVVFRKSGAPTANSLEANYPTPTVLTEIKTPWQVNFESKFRTPEPIVMQTLQDLTTFANDSIKYFSGTAIYNNTFTLDKLPDDKTIFIRLSAVSMMAKISINGQYVGGVWTAPYKLDIAKYVKQGSNDIKVEVVNTWVNRLIGDMNLPEAQRQTYSNVNPYSTQSTLQSSGLIGTVTVEYY